MLRRTGELKHGWISMLAIMGYITADITKKFPGCLSPSMDFKFADIPNGLSAVSKIPALGWVQIVAYAGLCDGTSRQSPPMMPVLDDKIAANIMSQTAAGCGPVLPKRGLYPLHAYQWLR